MANINVQGDNEMEVWERIRQQNRVDARNERLEKEREKNHRIFICGELVVNRIPVLKNIPVFKGKGSKAKNAASFAPLEKVLSALAADEKLMALLHEEISRQISVEE